MKLDELEINNRTSIYLMGNFLQKAFTGVIAISLPVIALQQIPSARKAEFYNLCLEREIASIEKDFWFSLPSNYRKEKKKVKIREQKAINAIKRKFPISDSSLISDTCNLIFSK